MAEIAQPMHAFDADKLHGETSSCAPRTRRRRIRGAERRKLHARPVQPGDRRSGGRDRAGRRDRRSRQRHFGRDHAHRARKRQFQRLQHSQDFLAPEAAHRRVHAFRKSAGPGQYGSRPAARAGTARSRFRPASGWWAAWPTRIGRCPRLRRSCCRSIGWIASWAAPFPPTKCARFSNRSNFKVEEIAPAHVFGVRPELARHQGRLHQGRSGGRSRPHDRLRFHHAGRSADARARAAGESRARVSSSRARDGRRAGIHRGLQLFVRERGAGARASTRPGDHGRGRQSHRRRSEPAAVAACCPESGKTSATTRGTSIRSACSKSAARFIRIAKSPHFAAAIYAKDDGVAGIARAEASGRMPAARRRRCVRAAARAYEHPQRAADVYRGRHARRPAVRISSAHGRGRPRRGARSGSDAARETATARTPRYQPLRRFPTSAFDLSVVAPAARR